MLAVQAGTAPLRDLCERLTTQSNALAERCSALEEELATLRREKHEAPGPRKDTLKCQPLGLLIDNPRSRSKEKGDLSKISEKVSGQSGLDPAKTELKYRVYLDLGYQSNGTF